MGLEFTLLSSLDLEMGRCCLSRLRIQGIERRRRLQPYQPGIARSCLLVALGYIVCVSTGSLGLHSPRVTF